MFTFNIDRMNVPSPMVFGNTKISCIKMSIKMLRLVIRGIMTIFCSKISTNECL